MNKSRINGRLPDKVGLYLAKAIIETRRPVDGSYFQPKEVNIKKARVTVMGEPKIVNLKTGESFEILRRKVLIGLLKRVGGKCHGNNSHHVFRYMVYNLVILPAS